MGYGNYTLSTVRRTFHLTQKRVPLFKNIPSVEPDQWLTETLKKGMELIIDTEKARSELIIMPILLASRELNRNRFTIYSGETFDVDHVRNLNGECDFILTYTSPLPSIQSPIITLVEAKKNDIDGSLGQCTAQMVAAQLFNRNEQENIDTIFGCVTTGEAWQFLKLEQDVIYIDKNRYYINIIPQILGIIQVIIDFYASQIDVSINSG